MADGEGHPLDPDDRRYGQRQTGGDSAKSIDG
jgi:hypothetical protein